MYAALPYILLPSGLSVFYLNLYGREIMAQINPQNIRTADDDRSILTELSLCMTNGFHLGLFFSIPDS